VAPIVTGDVNLDALDDLVRLCVQLDKVRGGADGDSGQAAPEPDTARAREALERAVIGKAVDLLSGPGGLASFLRRRQLGARLGGPSLPLNPDGTTAAWNKDKTKVLHSHGPPARAG